MTQTEVSLIDLSKSPYAKVKPLPIGAVTMHDGFWKPRMEANRAKAIPRLLELLEQHGRIENFRVAKTRVTKERSELYCRDSDTYKWLEACALVLESSEDPDIRRMMDQVIDLVAGAQYDDGYLNTFYSGAKLPERFTNLLYHHELYSAGHLFQAAVAHHRATGSTKLLNVAIRFADLIVSQFGPGKIEQADGHPEAEMAFIELYRETGREEYLQLAKYFVDLQGFNDKAELSGHAVMAMYLAEGATDCYLETGDKHTWDALDRLWQDFVSNKMYVTGANGSRYKTEALGIAYELPNERAYAETCANAANGFWSWRMLAATGSCKYADMLERAFYNSFLSSWSLDGLGYFYCNPLANFTDYKRVEYFTVCCCPTNVVRTIAALPGYMYGADDDGVWIHLYDNSEVSGQLADGRSFNLIQSGRYPWDGTIEIGFEVDGEPDSTLHLRIPSWCETATVEVDGQTHPAVRGEYLALTRVWSMGSTVVLNLDMRVQVIEGDPRMTDSYGRVALQRGPLVYCLESPDNPTLQLRDIGLAPEPDLSAAWEPDLLNGVVAITANGFVETQPDNTPAYRPVGSAVSRKTNVPIKAIPYYAWANRGRSDMTVWLRHQ